LRSLLVADGDIVGCTEIGQDFLSSIYRPLVLPITFVKNLEFRGLADGLRVESNRTLVVLTAALGQILDELASVGDGSVWERCLAGEYKRSNVSSIFVL
jgi:hypothetical protein